MINWLRKLVGLGGTAKNLTSLSEEECKEEIKTFADKTNLTLFQGHVQNLYSTQRIKQTSTCPRCESETEKKVVTFVCATNTLPQIIISAENHFCTNCSSAIIDDKILQKNCEKGKIYRGIIGFYIRENIQTYQSLNEYVIRYHYDQNSKPSGIKITAEKIADYDPKVHASKGTKSQYKIPKTPANLMDRVERRDKRESLTDSKFKKNTKNRSSQKEDTPQLSKEQIKKAARSERARIAMENVGKKKQPKKTKSKEAFVDSVNENKQNFKEKVERKNNFNPKKRQKPVVENPNEKKNKQQDKKIEAQKEETKNLPNTKRQNPPARASQRKKQTPISDKKEDEKTLHQQTEKKQNVVETKQEVKADAVQTNENKLVDTLQENNTDSKKNRQNKPKRSTRKTRSNKRPIRKTVEKEQVISKNEQKNQPSTEKNQQNKKQQPKRQNVQKQKEVVEQKTTNEITTKPNENKEQPQKESVIEKLHQNLQESSKASVASKEEKQKEEKKESSRLARLRDENNKEKVSRRRPRTNVRPPIDLDLKTPNSRRRYNNTKNK